MELFVSVIIYCGLSLAKHIVGKQMARGVGGGKDAKTPSPVTQFDSTPHALIAFLQCPPRSHRQIGSTASIPLARYCEPAEIFETCY
jgi:hypothetical protein